MCDICTVTIIPFNPSTNALGFEYIRSFHLPVIPYVSLINNIYTNYVSNVKLWAILEALWNST